MLKAISGWVESFVERAYGDETFASFGFCSLTATYIIFNFITPAYLSDNFADPEVLDTQYLKNQGFYCAVFLLKCFISWQNQAKNQNPFTQRV